MFPPSPHLHFFKTCVTGMTSTTISCSLIVFIVVVCRNDLDVFLPSFLKPTLLYHIAMWRLMSLVLKWGIFQVSFVVTVRRWSRVVICGGRRRRRAVIFGKRGRRRVVIGGRGGRRRVVIGVRREMKLASSVRKRIKLVVGGGKVSEMVDIGREGRGKRVSISGWRGRRVVFCCGRWIKVVRNRRRGRMITVRRSRGMVGELIFVVTNDVVHWL